MALARTMSKGDSLAETLAELNAYRSALKDGFLTLLTIPFLCQNRERNALKLPVQAEQIHDLVGQRNIGRKRLKLPSKRMICAGRVVTTVWPKRQTRKLSLWPNKLKGWYRARHALNGEDYSWLCGRYKETLNLEMSLDYDRISPRYTSTIQCHSTRPEPSWAEQREQLRACATEYHC
jgi:hypothetical protein